MSKKATDILAYITWIGWLIAFLAGDKQNSKVHLNQGLVLLIVEIAGGIIISILSNFVPVLGFLSCVLSLACLVLAIMGIIYASKGEDKELPLIGGIKILK